MTNEELEKKIQKKNVDSGFQMQL